MLDEITDYEVKFLRQLIAGGEHHCRHCGEIINFLQNPTEEEVKEQGVKWACMRCDNIVCDIDSAKATELLVATDFESDVMKALDNLSNVMTDDEVDQIEDLLIRVKHQWHLQK